MKHLFWLAVVVFTWPVCSDAQICYYIAYNPFDCPNCNKGVEIDTKVQNSIFFFQKQYQIDSANLKRRYLFSDKARVVFSDSLYNKYGLDDRTTISNKEATLKCKSAAFTENASAIFKRITGKGKPTDTIILNYPIGKQSIREYQFTNDGKVYLLDALDNSVKLYDLFSGKMLDTLRMNKKQLRKIYTQFDMEDTSAYLYYKKGVARFTKEDLSTVKDISLHNDTLLVASLNYYFFLSGKDGTDTFFTHFESISLYKDTQLVGFYIPSSLKDRLLDTTQKALAEPAGIYEHDGSIYTSVYNSRYYKGKEKYVIGQYSLLKHQLTSLIKLSDKYKGDYNFTNPFYSKEFLVLAKSPEIYNLNTGTITDAHYFKQEFLQGKVAPNYPKYFNSDIKADDSYINILYCSIDPKLSNYYVRIDKKTYKVLYNKEIPRDFSGKRIMIDPYDYNSILALYDNNKLIVYRVFK